MLKLRFTFLLAAAMMLPMLAACSSGNSASDDAPLTKDAAFKVYSYDDEFLDVSQLSKSREAYKLILPDKGLAVNFSKFYTDADGSIMRCNVSISTVDEIDGIYNEMMLAGGEYHKTYSDVKLKYAKENERNGLVFRYGADHSSPDIDMKGRMDGLPRTTFYMVKNDTIRDVLKALLELPNMASVKQLIDTYQKIPYEVPAARDGNRWTYILQPPFTLTDNGINDILTMGMPVGDIPSKVDYLYDSVEKTKEVNEMEDEEYTALSFKRDGKEVMSGISFDGNTLDILSVMAHNVRILTKGGNPVRVGDNATSNGLKRNSDTGMWELGAITANIDTRDHIVSFQLGSW